MPAIRRTERLVFRAPTRGRDYLTVTAAARNEAAAMIEKKYPREQAEYEDGGRCTYPGYHWSSDSRLQRLHARLTLILLKTFRANQRKRCKEV